MDIVQFNNVWEMYRIKFVIDGKVSWENFWALKDISFKVEKAKP
jgi:ABC-type polysaccharide/polyol phosphate transport system ATPase subunit